MSCFLSPTVKRVLTQQFSYVTIGLIFAVAHTFHKRNSFLYVGNAYSFFVFIAGSGKCFAERYNYNFNYGQITLLVEGISDLILLRLIFPNYSNILFCIFREFTKTQL
jgi:hypothetical protein